MCFPPAQTVFNAVDIERPTEASKPCTEDRMGCGGGTWEKGQVWHWGCPPNPMHLPKHRSMQTSARDVALEENSSSRNIEAMSLLLHCRARRSKVCGAYITFVLIRPFSAPATTKTPQILKPLPSDLSPWIQLSRTAQSVWRACVFWSATIKPLFKSDIFR